MKGREAALGDFLSCQPEVTEEMRKLLIDWLVGVAEVLELNHGTLNTAVKISNQYLSKKLVRRANYQLVGGTAVFLTSKIYNIPPPAQHRRPIPLQVHSP